MVRFKLFSHSLSLSQLQNCCSLEGRAIHVVPPIWKTILLFCLKKDMLNFEFLQYYLPKTMITKYYLDIYLVLLLHHSFKSDFESTPSWAYPVLNFTGSQWFDRPLQTCGFWQMMWQEVGKFVQNQRFHGSDFINIFGHQFLWILWNTVSRIHKFVGNGFTNTCCCHAHFLLQWTFDFVDQLNNKSWCLTNIDDTTEKNVNWW